MKICENLSLGSVCPLGFVPLRAPLSRVLAWRLVSVSIEAGVLEGFLEGGVIEGT